MEIMSPELLWISGRCYRINPTYREDQLKQPESRGYVEEDLYDDEEPDDFLIELTDNNRFKTSYHIPQAFFSQIIGSKGATKKRIEGETKTQIRIPKPGVEGDVVIIGPTRQSVCSARRKINLIVLAARNKQQFTHFLSVPFTSSHIKEAFIKFKDAILSGPQIFGLDSSLFQNPNKLHLTIATLSLMDNEDRALAAQILYDCRETVINSILHQSRNIDIELRGLEYMNDDPSAVDILYGKVNSDVLQQIADGIVEKFVEKGLTQKKTDHVKLHVTLINSLFRYEINSDAQVSLRETFDARQILETYENYCFGIEHVNEIHLSQRYSTSCDGFYEATGILKL